MRVLVFSVLWAPLALTGGVACGSELRQRPQGPAPVYEPWVLPSWSGNSSSGPAPEGDALDALLDADDTPPVPSSSPESASEIESTVESSTEASAAH